MSFWTAIVIIMGIVVIGSVMSSRYKALNGSVPDQQGPNQQGSSDHTSAREQELEAELTEMRERIKVLERIATDGHETQRLSAEIDKLRDE